MAEIRLREFIWLCLKEAWRTSWEKADTGATVFGIVAPVVVQFVPKWESAMTSLVWQIPIASLASIAATRLLLSPFLLYRKCDSDLRSAQSALRAKYTKQQIHEWIGQRLQDARVLADTNPRTDSDVLTFQRDFEAWSIKTEAGLRAFELTAEAHLFATADSGFVRLPERVITQGDGSFQYLQDVRESCSARLLRYQTALRETLKTYSGSD